MTDELAEQRAGYAAYLDSFEDAEQPAGASAAR